MLAGERSTLNAQLLPNPLRSRKMDNSMRRTESFFESADGLRLYHQQWFAAHPRAHLIITHGLGEHSDCYDDFARELTDYDLHISAWDLRGHGRSQGPRGAIEDLYVLTQDLEIFVRSILKSVPPQEPVLLMGHSMGALILLKTLLGLREHLHRPLILSSPFLGVALPVPQWKKAASGVLSQVVPALTLTNEIRYEDLSRDPEKLRRYPRDPLRHDRISAGLYESALQAIESVFFHAEAYAGPIFLVGSESDPVVSSGEMRSFASHFVHPDSRLLMLPGRKHEVFNDLGREEAFAALRPFLEKMTGLQPKRRPHRL